MNVAHLNKEMFCPNNFFHPKKTFSKEKKIKNFTNENSSLLLPGKNDFSNKEFLV